MEPAQDVPKIGPKPTADSQSAKEWPTDLQCRIHPGTQTDPGPPTKGVKRGLRSLRAGKNGTRHVPVSAARHSPSIPVPVLQLKLLRLTLNNRYRFWPARVGANADKTLQCESLEPRSRRTVGSPHLSDAGPHRQPALRWTNTGHAGLRSPPPRSAASMSNIQADFNLKNITLKRCRFPAVKIKTIWME